MICIAHQTLCERSITKNELGAACSTYVGGMHTGFRRGDLRRRDHVEYLVLDGKIILKWIFNK